MNKGNKNIQEAWFGQFDYPWGIIDADGTIGWGDNTGVKKSKDPDYQHDDVAIEMGYTAAGDAKDKGSVQFIIAKHEADFTVRSKTGAMATKIIDNLIDFFREHKKILRGSIRIVDEYGIGLGQDRSIQDNFLTGIYENLSDALTDLDKKRNRAHLAYQTKNESFQSFRNKLTDLQK
jgi:hypothetical protein